MARKERSRREAAVLPVGDSAHFSACSQGVAASSRSTCEQFVDQLDYDHSVEQIQGTALRIP